MTHQPLLPPEDTHVILLHGILRSDQHMRWLEKGFLRHGYHVTNVDYPSRKMTIEQLAETYLRPVIEGSTHPHLVLIGYSMGGLIVRAYLASDTVDGRIDKVLMLGTPNGGSEITDFLKSQPPLDVLYQYVFGESGQQLGVKDHFAKNLPLPDGITYGVIAGSETIDPISTNFILPKPNDGKVSVESTKLPVPHAHVVLPVSHTFMPQTKKVVDASLTFVEKGHF